MAGLQFHGGIDANIKYAERDQDVPRVSQLFGLQLKLQLLTGLLPTPELPHCLPQWVQVGLIGITRLYCLLVILISLHLGLLFSKTTLDALPTGDLEDITDALTMTVIYFFTAYASIYWCVRSRRLQLYLNYINQEYRHHSLAGVSFVNCYTTYRWARNFSALWMGACLAGVIFWGITPVVLGHHALPLHCWYPFDALADHIYPLVYAIQLYGQIIVGAAFGYGGLMFVTFSLLLLAQFDVLYCSLKNLDAHARLLSGETLQQLHALQCHLLLDDATCELGQYAMLREHATDLQKMTRKRMQPAPSLKRAAHDGLVECVRLHRFILNCAAELEQIFSPYCLCKSLQITVQLCLLVFVGVSGSREVVRVINQLQYLGLTLFELLMFTYCGELLRRHSVRVGDAFWRGAWWQHAPQMGKDMIIFLANSRRAVQVTAGKFYVMDVNRLRSVITQAFSFLTLLQKLAAKKAVAES
ncbi:putative odorant receptor 85e [Drosophila sulfurigaster albostrigata]|uniref:putative odorant receptor 85e n=1 Tax=Drosophila sulfurigaster albostrigata TaxID=89887 RepID=UPI002D219B0A|nr:putative odorant receptor 85e [Drosophila sulfurigaster albostrigata]